MLFNAIISIIIKIEVKAMLVNRNIPGTHLTCGYKVIWPRKQTDWKVFLWVVAGVAGGEGGGGGVVRLHLHHLQSGGLQRRPHVRCRHLVHVQGCPSS